MARLKLYLLGHPVAQSRSPVMQNAALAHLGVNAVYETLDVLPEDLQATLERLDGDENVLGCNVTVPHKVGVYEWLAARGRPLLPRARVAGAVNTLFRGSDGRFGGQSTDFDGAMGAILREGYGSDARALHQDLPLRDVAILGSGGSALSIAANLVHPWSAYSDSEFAVGLRPLDASAAVMPRSLTVFARNLDKAEALVHTLGTVAIPTQARPLADFPAWNAGRSSLVIQTTTVGMDTGESAGTSPLPAGVFSAGQIAFDLVYKPHETPFLRDAAACGATVVHGIGMLVGQGARSLEEWCASGGLAPTFERARVTETMARALGI